MVGETSWERQEATPTRENPVQGITCDMANLITREGISRITERNVPMESMEFSHSIIFYLYTLEQFNEPVFLKVMKEQ